MATLRGKAFIWKGTSWGTGTNGWGGAANATGAGYTGGYWNHADNWYEKGDGITDPPEGSTAEGSANWWKPASRFPRGRDIAIFKRYSDDEHLGMDAGPVETLQWGGFTNGAWFGATGDAGSGATQEPLTMTIEASYARTGYGHYLGSTFGSIGLWGPTFGGGSFGGVAVTDRQKLMLNCTELKSEWDPGDRYNAWPPSFKLEHSNIASAKLNGLERKHWYDCTVNKIDINATDLAYTTSGGVVQHRYSAGYSMTRGTINESLTVRGRIPHIVVNWTKGTTGAGFDAIRFVNIVGTSPHWDQNPENSTSVILRCSVDELNFWPTRTYTIGDIPPTGGFRETTVGIGPSSATGGITMVGEGRCNVRQLNQGWGYDTGLSAGSSWGCGVWIKCGLTLENHIFKSGTIEMDKWDVQDNDDIVISDGEIDVNAVVKGIHKTNSQFTGFRIGNFDDATGGYRVVNTIEGVGPNIEFPPGIYVKADYAGYTGGSIPGLGYQSGGGK